MSDDNAGWLKKMLSWDWHECAFNGYPGWELVTDAGPPHPPFVHMIHVRGKGEVESHQLCIDWDDVAEVRFYQRDWTDDGLPFVLEGETYWSGWWFQTVAERDRFVKWAEKAQSTCDFRILT